MNKRLAALGLSLGLAGGALLASGSVAGAQSSDWMNQPCPTCDGNGGPTGVPGTDLQFQCKDTTGRYQVRFFNPQGLPGLEYQVEGVTTWKPLPQAGATVYVMEGTVLRIRAQIRNANGRVIFRIDKPAECNCGQTTTTTTASTSPTTSTPTTSSPDTTTATSSPSTSTDGSSTTATALRAPRLPETGSTTGPLVMAGAGLVGLGIVAGAFSRRSTVKS